jgi:hypothetical protein
LALGWTTQDKAAARVALCVFLFSCNRYARTGKDKCNMKLLITRAFHLLTHACLDRETTPESRCKVESIIQHVRCFLRTSTMEYSTYRPDQVFVPWFKTLARLQTYAKDAHTIHSISSIRNLLLIRARRVTQQQAYPISERSSKSFHL